MIVHKGSRMAGVVLDNNSTEEEALKDAEEELVLGAVAAAMATRARVGRGGADSRWQRIEFRKEIA